MTLARKFACLRTGEKGVREIFAKFGKARVLTAIEDFFDHAHQKTLTALGELPKGTWSAEDWLDDDGITDDMIKMAVEVDDYRRPVHRRLQWFVTTGSRARECALWWNCFHGQDVLQISHLTPFAQQSR